MFGNSVHNLLFQLTEKVLNFRVNKIFQRGLVYIFIFVGFRLIFILYFSFEHIVFISILNIKYIFDLRKQVKS